MSLSIAVALLVCLVGGVVALLNPPNRFARLGEIAFGVGLFFVLQAVATHVLRLGP